jgi:hypothetical protein
LLLFLLWLAKHPLIVGVSLKHGNQYTDSNTDIFNTFSHGSTKFPLQQYIRMNTNYNSPVIDLKSNDLRFVFHTLCSYESADNTRCNVGGEDGSSTDTVTVAAGDSFTFTSDVAVYHDGPLSIYMAKAPTTAAAFDGSGTVWFKILDIGPTFAADGTSTWPLSQTYTSTFPKQLPTGEYLLRIQQLGIHNPYPGGTPQFYIGCAQVSVTNGGTGNPGPLVAIPGFMDGTEPGYVVNIYSNFHNYTVPGPAVWSGAAGSGTAPVSVSSVATTVAPTTLATVTKSTSSATKATTTTKASTTSSTAPISTGATAAKYAQCGGQGWTGATVCVAGTTCKASGAYYSQCL